MNIDGSFTKSKKVSSELFSLTYGALVSQLIKNYNNDMVKVNEKLESMGSSIGKVVERKKKKKINLTKKYHKVAV